MNGGMQHPRGSWPSACCPGRIPTPDGHIYLVDFGLAKLLKGTQATTTGARAMTPGYSPPEQYGTARTDPRTDIYSLGATLYAALTGIIPEDALARAMDNVELTPLRRHNPKVSRKHLADGRDESDGDQQEGMRKVGDRKGGPAGGGDPQGGEADDRAPEREVEHHG